MIASHLTCRMSRRRHSTCFRVLLALAIALSAIGGQATAQSAPQPPAAAPPAPQQPASAGCPESLPALFDQVSPSVVSIGAISINPYDIDRRIERVSGSGVIIDSSGLILTNSHVVFGRQVISVTLDDGTNAAGETHRRRPDLRHRAHQDPAADERHAAGRARSGTRRRLAVGTEVYAIGNPLGLDQTLTRGIVSAVNRHGAGRGVVARRADDPDRRVDQSRELGRSAA